MAASKEYFLIMREHQFNAMEPRDRMNLIYVEARESNEYENNKNDANYIKLEKLQRQAKKDLQIYLFNKRNN
jgi:hypothetical protein